MQTQTMSKAPNTQSTSLPPLQNLPSWSRSSLERRKQPKSIIRDRLQPIQSLEERGMDMENEDRINSLGRVVSAPSRSLDLPSNQRIVTLENSLNFLQDEHSQILDNLHTEMERLKAENKALKFKIVMISGGVNTEDSSSVHQVFTGISPADEIQGSASYPLNGKEDIGTQDSPKPRRKELRKGSGSAKNRTYTPPQHTLKRQPLEKKDTTGTPPSSGKKTGSGKGSGKSRSQNRSKPKAQVVNDMPQPNAASSLQILNSSKAPQASYQQSVAGNQSMLMVTLRKDNSIAVHFPAESTPRSPTLSECKTIIKQQQETNTKQAQELTRLKSDVRDTLYTQKWSSDAYVLPKPYIKGTNVAGISGEHLHGNRPLPKLPVREQPHPGRLANRARLAPENVSLPMLRPNINSTVADRRRRQQAILRGRTGRRDLY